MQVPIKVCYLSVFIFILSCFHRAHSFVGIKSHYFRFTKIYSVTKGRGDASAALDRLPLELSEENAILVVDEIKEELGTLFGYDKGSKSAGITGEIKFEELDGPAVVVSLSGRFWHATDTVMLRVESFLKQRIPEVIEVKLDVSKSKIVDDNRLNTDGGKKRLF